MKMKGVKSTSFRPVNGKMLVKVDPMNKMTAGGIKLVSQLTDPVDRGTIVRISNEGYDQQDKHFTNDEYAVGDRIVFDFAVREYFEFDDGMFVLLSKPNIFCKLEGE